MTIETAAIKQFSDEFFVKYQATQMLLTGVSQEMRGIVGEAWQLPIMDQVQLTDRGAYCSPIPPTLPAVTVENLFFNNSTALVCSDKFEQALININLRAQYVKRVTEAVHRKEDQTIVNALGATLPLDTIPAGGKNMNLAKLLALKEIFDYNNVPEDSRYFLGTASQERSLLSEDQVTSSDYNTTKVLNNGRLVGYVGFKFLWMGNRVEGGIPFSSPNIRECYAWNADALYSAWGAIDPSETMVDVQWSTERQSYLIVPSLRMGAMGLTDGIIHVDCVDNVYGA